MITAERVIGRLALAGTSGSSPIRDMGTATALTDDMCMCGGSELRKNFLSSCIVVDGLPSWHGLPSRWQNWSVRPVFGL